jgi:hypothetical protein
MEYIDHSDYKRALDTFKKGTNKKKLNESVEEGNAFTRALAKTPKGGKFKVGSKTFKDKSGYDDSSVDEYGINDQYPGAWPFREEEIKEDDYSIDPDNINSGDTDPENIGESDYNEGLNPAPMQATGQTIDTVEEKEDLSYITDPHKTDYSVKPFKLPKRVDTRDLDYDPQDVSRFKPDYMDTDDPEDDDDEINNDFLDMDDDDMYTKLPKNFQKFVSKDKDKYSLRENQAPFGLSVLSVSEREQLKEYVKSVKTIQQEIKKLVSKANEARIGGDRTGLVMNVNEEEKEKEEPKAQSIPQQDAPSYEEIEAKLDPELHEKSVDVLTALRRKLEREGKLTPLEIEMFIKHEIRKIARKAIMSQHDY